MAVDALAHHPSVAHYLRFVATTAGRDKLLRAVQYFARFYAWYLLRTNGTPAQMAPWQGLKRQLGLARKLLRVGKPVEHLQAPADAADAKAPAVPAFLRYAAYLALDGLALSDALGVVRWRRAPAAQRQAYRCWALTLVFSLAAQLYTLRRLARREAAINRKDGEGVVEGKRIKVSVLYAPLLARPASGKMLTPTPRQREICQPPPAALRPLRPHHPHLGPRPGRLRRWLRRPGRHPQQRRRCLYPVEKGGLTSGACPRPACRRVPSRALLWSIFRPSLERGCDYCLESVLLCISSGGLISWPRLVAFVQ